MNTHPYLRAFLAGAFVPTLVLPLMLAGFVVLRLGLQFPFPIERFLVFPIGACADTLGSVEHALDRLSPAHPSSHRRAWSAASPAADARRRRGRHLPRDPRPRPERSDLVSRLVLSLSLDRACISCSSGRLLPVVEIHRWLREPRPGYRVSYFPQCADRVAPSVAIMRTKRPPSLRATT